MIFTRISAKIQVGRPRNLFFARWRPLRGHPRSKSWSETPRNGLEHDLDDDLDDDLGQNLDPDLNQDSSDDLHYGVDHDLNNKVDIITMNMSKINKNGGNGLIKIISFVNEWVRSFSPLS